MINENKNDKDCQLQNQLEPSELTGILSSRATLFECLRHNHRSLRQVPMM